MAKHKRNEDAPPPPTARNESRPTDERDRVAQRAYELYMARGGGDGQDLDDWLLAEGELRGRSGPDSDES
jgi:hypothetical protein